MRKAWKNSKIDRTNVTVIESLNNFENKCAITLPLTYPTILYTVYIRYTLHMINDEQKVPTRFCTYILTTILSLFICT